MTDLLKSAEFAVARATKLAALVEIAEAAARSGGKAPAKRLAEAEAAHQEAVLDVEAYAALLVEAVAAVASVET